MASQGQLEAGPSKPQPEISASKEQPKANEASPSSPKADNQNDLQPEAEFHPSAHDDNDAEMRDADEVTKEEIEEREKELNKISCAKPLPPDEIQRIFVDPQLIKAFQSILRYRLDPGKAKGAYGIVDQYNIKIRNATPDSSPKDEFILDANHVRQEFQRLLDTLKVYKAGPNDKSEPAAREVRLLYARFFDKRWPIHEWLPQLTENTQKALTTIIPDDQVIWDLLDMGRGGPDWNKEGLGEKLEVIVKDLPSIIGRLYGRSGQDLQEQRVLIHSLHEISTKLQENAGGESYIPVDDVLHFAKFLHTNPASPDVQSAFEELCNSLQRRNLDPTPFTPPLLKQLSGLANFREAPTQKIELRPDTTDGWTPYGQVWLSVKRSLGYAVVVRRGTPDHYIFESHPGRKFGTDMPRQWAEKCRRLEANSISRTETLSIEGFVPLSKTDVVAILADHTYIYLTALRGALGRDRVGQALLQAMEERDNTSKLLNAMANLSLNPETREPLSIEEKKQAPWLTPSITKPSIGPKEFKPSLIEW
ncbi:MAG: hypothetical protein Q9217_001782 [Psora testacea]